MNEHLHTVDLRDAPLESQISRYILTVDPHQPATVLDLVEKSVPHGYERRRVLLGVSLMMAVNSIEVHDVTHAVTFRNQWMFN